MGRAGLHGSLKRGAVHPILKLTIYLAPFLVIAIAIRIWMKRQVNLSDVQTEGDPKRERARFLLGIWRRRPR